MGSDEKANSSFRLILETSFPFCRDSRQEKALKTQKFSCNLKIMTPDGKINPTDFSQTFEINSLYHRCSCMYFKILPKHD